MLNFLKILCEKGTLRELPGCARAYRVRYNQAHGILEAAATTAVAMTEQQVKSLHEKLEKLTGKTIDLKTKVDPAVLGGIRLEYRGHRAGRYGSEPSGGAAQGYRVRDTVIHRISTRKILRIER